MASPERGVWSTAWRVAAALALCAAASWAAPAPPDVTDNPITPCVRNGTSADLNQCIASGIEHFFKTAKHGLPDIGLDSLDPLVVKHLQLEQGSGKLAVSLSFQQVRFKGLSDSEVNSVRMNVNDKKMEVSLRAPVYEIDGFYTCEGAVYELPLSSSGRFTITMTDVTSAWMLYFKTSTMNKQKAIAVNRFLLDISPSNVVYRFDKKFDGENSLGDAMDEFMNENALEIYNDVKPKLMKMFSELFLDHANQVFLNYPNALDLPK